VQTRRVDAGEREARLRVYHLTEDCFGHAGPYFRGSSQLERGVCGAGEVGGDM
jgi:hypothetical protein